MKKTIILLAIITVLISTGCSSSAPTENDGGKTGIEEAKTTMGGTEGGSTELNDF